MMQRGTQIGSADEARGPTKEALIDCRDEVDDELPRALTEERD